jgi:microcystin-dependent protein
MTIQLYANNAKTTLSAPITATQTSITVAAGTGAEFPTITSGQVFQVTLVSASSSTVFEICTCTAISGDTLTVIRGQEGTSKTPFTTGDIVANYDTAGVMTGLVQSTQLQNQYYQYTIASGTANALTGTIPSSLTSLPDGMYLTVVSAYANTAPATLLLTLGSTLLSAYPIVKGNNAALVAGDIPGAGYPLQLNWSASYNSFVLANPATGIFVTTVPTGAIMQFPATTPPTGYLITEGQLISRATYASLWSFAQTSGNLISDTDWLAGQYGSFSSGDGSTTFRLPQFGGYFLRTLDNGNGIDPARAIGTVQQNQNLSHTHSALSTSSVSDPGHIHGILVETGGAGAGSGKAELSNQNQNIGTVTQTGYTGLSVSTSTTVVNSGGSEARPINIAILTCIKY